MKNNNNNKNKEKNSSYLNNEEMYSLWSQKIKCKTRHSTVYNTLPHQSTMYLSFMISTPLEQFAIVSLIPFHFGNLYLSFTNSSLYLFLTIGLIILLFSMVTQNGGFLVPSRWQSLVEMIYEFVVSLVDEQIGQKGKKFFPLIFTTFVFLLFTNLLGMIPYSFTATSHRSARPRPTTPP